MRVFDWLFGVVPIERLEAEQKERLDLMRRNITMNSAVMRLEFELGMARILTGDYLNELVSLNAKYRELEERHDKQLHKKNEALGALRALGKINEIAMLVGRELNQENEELRVKVAKLTSKWANGETLIADLRQQLDTQRQQLETLQDELGDVAVQERHPLAVRQAEDAIRWRRVLTILDSKNDYAQELREALAKAGIPTNG